MYVLAISQLDSSLYQIDKILMQYNGFHSLDRSYL